MIALGRKATANRTSSMHPLCAYRKKVHMSYDVSNINTDVDLFGLSETANRSNKNQIYITFLR